MTLPSFRRYSLLAAILAVCVIPFLHAEEQAAPVMGDLWEVTTQMTMEGMPNMIPARKQKVCAPREWAEPPAGMDERQKCTNSDFALAGTKATWKTRCAGPPETTGEGEITRDGADAYAGTIKFASPDGTMTVKLSGKKLGECELPKK